VGKGEIADEKAARARKWCIMYSRERRREDQRYREEGGEYKCQQRIEGKRG